MRLPESINQIDYYELCLSVSKEKQDKLLNRNNMQSLFSGLLLKYVLNMFLGIANKEVKFQYSKYGKPALIDKPDIKFNLSHSGAWIFLGLSNYEIGVDIQKIGENKLNIAKRFFTMNEYKNLLLLKDNDATIKFYEYWALKESYVKAVGKGLTIPLNTIEFFIKKEKINGFIDGNKVKNFQFKLVKMDSMYTSAVCLKSSKNELRQLTINKLEADEVIGWVKCLR